MKEERKGIEIALARGDGGTDLVVVPDGRALVGAGAHCDVRIGGPAVGAVHVELAIEGDRLLALAHAAPTPALVADRALGAGARVVVAPEDVIAVASHRLRARIVVLPGRPRAARGKLAAVALATAVVLTLPAVVYASLRNYGDARIESPPSSAVALWDDGRPPCTARDPQQALALATRLRAIGQLQRERRPFAVGDGVSAVLSFRGAAACFARAERGDLEGAAQRDADELARDVQHDYHVHEVRLAHALDTGDDTLALHEVRVLRKLVATRSGPWVDWLAYAERQLDARTTAERRSE